MDRQEGGERWGGGAAGPPRGQDRKAVGTGTAASRPGGPAAAAILEKRQVLCFRDGLLHSIFRHTYLPTS